MKKAKAPAIVSDINVTPMVDVMLVLLIIFMVITPLLSKGQTVELTKAKNAIAMKEADAEDAILVAITRNGETFLMPGNDRVVPEDLPAKVSDLLTGRLDKTVYIKADARAKFQVVTDVVDFLRGAGVDELGLLTEGQKSQDEMKQ
jgi:biopolymer transport protein ExbD/biopolymer transport protein TolR